MKKRGYTIIELVIALAITASLLALTLPRFDAFQNHTALRTQVQLLASCLQSANATMTTPTIGSLGTQTTVTISSNSADAKVSCEYASKDEANGSYPLTTLITANSTYICSATYSSFSNGFTTALITLHAATHGVIDSVTFDRTPPTISSGGTGQGQQLTIQFSTSKLPTGSSCIAPVTLLVPASGSPIEISS